MHLIHIPLCSIQNRNVHISVLNGALWDMEQVHSGIFELGQLRHNHQYVIDTDVFFNIYIKKSSNIVATRTLAEIMATFQQKIAFSRIMVSLPDATYITVTSQWARWRLKAPASQLFTQPFIRTQIKENIKAPRHWPLWGEFTDSPWIPRAKGQ